MTQFSEWVRRTRRAKDLTMEVVADRAGVKFPVWARWESGTQTPRRETVIKIAQALEERPDNALLLAGYLPSASARNADLSPLEERLSHMEPERRAKAVDALCQLADTFLMAS